MWFFNGVFLKDTYNALVNAQEGKTKLQRQWRFTSTAEIDEAKILEYLSEAIEIEKKGLRISTEKFTPISIPQILENELKIDGNLKAAFDSFTPGKQKEFILFINEAKKEATKLRRLEKVKAMILNGIGLNDKYK